MEYSSIINLLDHKPVALIGVSAKAEKFGNEIFKTLTQCGYEISPIHHSLDSIQGKKCYHSLSEIQPPPKTVIFCARPKNVLSVLQEFKKLHGEKVWFQQGVKSQEAFDFCRSHDLEFYQGKCILLAVNAFPHKLHKFFLRLFGRLK